MLLEDPPQSRLQQAQQCFKRCFVRFFGPKINPNVVREGLTRRGKVVLLVFVACWFAAFQFLDEALRMTIDLPAWTSILCANVGVFVLFVLAFRAIAAVQRHYKVNTLRV